MLSDERGPDYSPWQKPKSLRERIEAAQEKVRLSSPPCSCPGQSWDSITPPPPKCERHEGDQP